MFPYKDSLFRESNFFFLAKRISKTIGIAECLSKGGRIGKDNIIDRHTRKKALLQVGESSIGQVPNSNREEAIELLRRVKSIIARNSPGDGGITKTLSDCIQQLTSNPNLETEDVPEITAVLKEGEKGVIAGSEEGVAMKPPQTGTVWV